MAYRITWEDKGVYLKFSDDVKYEDSLVCNGLLYGDERFDQLEYEIADFLEARTTDFTEKQTQIIARLEKQASRWNPNLKIAHVTKDPELIHMIQLYAESLKDSSWKVGVFSTLNEARRWISES